MLRKILACLVVVLALFALIISFSDERISHLAKERFARQGAFGSDRYTFGDLYGMSFIPQFRAKDDVVKQKALKDKSESKKSYNLYIIGDSYLGYYYHQDTFAFPGVESLHYASIEAKETSSWMLQDSAINILLLERTERWLSSFADTGFYKNVTSIPTKSNETHTPVLQKNEPIPPPHLSSLAGKVFNPMLEANLEFMLFDYSFLTPLKELRALIALKFFNRTNKDVSLSADRQYLFLNETIVTSNLSSSFYPHSDSAVNAIVAGINHFLGKNSADAFDLVLFSAIPNPVSVLYPEMGAYNQLAKKVMHHPSLQAQPVDAIPAMLARRDLVFRKNDTHWTHYGYCVWANSFGNVVTTAIAKKGLQ